MKKTIGIISILIVIVFFGSFATSRLRRKLQEKQTLSQSIPSDVQQERLKTVSETPKAVFYSSVGGSSPLESATQVPERISRRYTIELGTLESQKDAESLLLNLKSKGIDGFYTPTRRGGQVYYHVRLGLFTNQDEAEQNLKKIATRVNLQGRVAKLN